MQQRKLKEPVSIQNICLTAAIFYGSTLLIVKRSPNDSFLPNKWELVGGTMDIGEKYEDSLRREVLEEVGLQITIGVPYYCFEWTKKEDNLNRFVLDICFLCRLSGQKNIVLSREHSEYRFITEDEINQYFDKDSQLYPAIKLAF